MTAATLARPAISFEVEPKAFANAVGWVAKRVSAKGSNPALGSIMLYAHDAGLTFLAFDGDVAVSAKVGASIENNGKVLVSGRLLDAMAKTFTKRVKVTIDNERLLIRSGGTWRLPTMPVAEYPVLPTTPPVIGSVNAEVLGRLIARVAEFADHDGSYGTPCFIGVYLRFGDELEVMATDGYRFAVDRGAWQPTTMGGSFELLVPAQAVAQTLPMLVADGGDIVVSASDGLAGFASATRSAVCRQMEGPFTGAQFARHLPAVSETPVRVAVHDLLDAIRRAELLREPKAPISLALERDEVSVLVSGAETGDGDEPVACEYVGEAKEILLNPIYLREALQAIGTDYVDLSFTQPKWPFLVSPADSTDPYRQMVVPIRPPVAP